MRNEIEAAYTSYYEQLEPNLEKIVSKHDICNKDSPLYIPISELATLHADVTDCDTKLSDIRQQMMIPVFGEIGNNGMDFPQNKFKQSMLECFEKNEPSFLKQFQNETWNEMKNGPKNAPYYLRC